MSASKNGKTMLGVASTSFAGSAIGSAAGKTLGKVAVPVLDTMQFLERCHRLGAAGIQATINGNPQTIRARADELGMWVEAMIDLRSADEVTIERQIQQAKEAGCSVARDGLLAGRRYQSFASEELWAEWVESARKAIAVAVPLFEKHRVTLALENHKDWTLDEYIGLFRKYESQYFGACVDFGNNLSLLDDPLLFIDEVIPYAKATHFKDIAVEPTKNGFQMAEVVPGKGFLPLRDIAVRLLEANSSIRFAVEMITRDPLEVACREESYWIAFPGRNRECLEHTLQFVEEHKSREPLPRVDHLDADMRSQVEEQNVREYLRWADSNLREL